GRRHGMRKIELGVTEEHDARNTRALHGLRTIGRQSKRMSQRRSEKRLEGSGIITDDTKTDGARLAPGSLLDHATGKREALECRSVLLEITKHRLSLALVCECRDAHRAGASFALSVQLLPALRVWQLSKGPGACAFHCDDQKGIQRVRGAGA